MKKIGNLLAVVGCIFLQIGVYAQGVCISEDGSAPDASAISN